MIPRSYSMDAHTRAHDLASSILSSSSPPDISYAVSATETFLRKLSSDQSRAFFSTAFPALICRLFGFDDSPPPLSRSPASAPVSTAWINQAHHDPDLSSRLFSLLSPNGPLISAISSADRHGLIKYVFPQERLPEWMRCALQSDRHSSILADLCPLFRGRVKEDPVQGAFQLQLNAFEYYIFWFAYYPVCKGNSEGADDNSVQKSRRKSRLENWTSSLPAVIVNPSRLSGKKPEVSLYLRLLYAYLCTFGPNRGLGSYQPYRSSLLHYSSSGDVSAFEQAEFLVYTLMHFWLVDNDFSPLPLALCHPFGISFPHRAVSGETPPTAGLGEVVTLFVKYLNSYLVSPDEGSNQKDLAVVDKVSRRTMLSLESSAGSWNSAIQRPFYRFLLRTFLFCPIGASMKNVAVVLSAWVTYMVPWRISPEDFVFESTPLGKSESSKKESAPARGKSAEENERSRSDAMYLPLWESYVAYNYLFYSSLFMHFLGFAHKFLHANVETVVDMVLKVLNILTSSKELLDFLRKVDTAYHSKQSGAYSPVSCVDKYVPSIRQQLKDWEDGLCESDTDGSFLHDNWNQDVNLFSDGEDGAHKLLQLFVLRAEHEIQVMSGEKHPCFEALDSIKSQMELLFGGASIPTHHLPNSTGEVYGVREGRGEVFTPKHPGIGKRKWADVKYRGDWMHRPISDTEVAWLARLLIGLSDWLNVALGLDRANVDFTGGATTNGVEITRNNEWSGAKEAAVMLITLIASLLVSFGQSVLRFMRGHGMKINLRVFSSKKFAMFLFIYASVYALRKACFKPASSSLSGEEVEHTRNYG